MSNRDIEYQADPAGMRRLMNSSQMSRVSVQAGQEGLARARATAPRKSGAFASGFEVVAKTVPGGRHDEPRSGAVIQNTAPHAGYVRRSASAQNFMASLAAHVNAVSGR